MYIYIRKVTFITLAQTGSIPQTRKLTREKYNFFLKAVSQEVI